MYLLLGSENSVVVSVLAVGTKLLVTEVVEIVVAIIGDELCEVVSALAVLGSIVLSEEKLNIVMQTSRFVYHYHCKSDTLINYY